jgi:hypothetical protein
MVPASVTVVRPLKSFEILRCRDARLGNFVLQSCFSLQYFYTYFLPVQCHGNLLQFHLLALNRTLRFNCEHSCFICGNPVYIDVPDVACFGWCFIRVPSVFPGTFWVKIFRKITVISIPVLLNVWSKMFILFCSLSPTNRIQQNLNQIQPNSVQTISTQPNITQHKSSQPNPT